MIRNVRLLAWAPVVSATLMILAIYSSLVAAYLQLGRRPRSSMDDPKSIGGFSTDLYDLCLPLVFVLFFIWAGTSFLACLLADSPKTEHRRELGLGFAAGLIAFGLYVVLLFSSPDSAIVWFFD